MAQNLDQRDRFYQDNFSRTQLVEKLKYGFNPVEYQDGKVPYNEVLIEPYRVGILPALAGIFLRTFRNEILKSLNDVHRVIAVSNYYKFSLHTTRDINPNTLRQYTATREKYSEYLSLNDKLVQVELDYLKPKVILTFRGEHIRKIKKWARLRDNILKVHVIND